MVIFQFEIILDVLIALSVSFEYLCYYGTTAIINVLLFQCGDRSELLYIIIMVTVNYFMFHWCEARWLYSTIF